MSAGSTLIHVLGSGLLLVAAVSVARGAAPRDARLRAELETVSRLAIYFGHQSVGANILEGVQRLAAQEGITLRIVESPSAAGAARGTCAHGFIGANGDPQAKIQGFVRALEGSAAVDVAFMKLCYVDFHAGTDPRALFERYEASLRELRKQHPTTTFVHVTAPLTTIQGGVKALAKRLLGRETSEPQNARRDQFNALMRKAYEGREPLFDLARLESTHPDGRAETISWNGKTVPVLVSAYTDDGGHLNAQGQERVARELIRFLAALPRTAPGAPGTAAR